MTQRQEGHGMLEGFWRRDRAGREGPHSVDVPLPHSGPSSPRSSAGRPPAENLAQILSPATQFPHMHNWGTRYLPPSCSDNEMMRPCRALTWARSSPHLPYGMAACSPLATAQAKPGLQQNQGTVYGSPAQVEPQPPMPVC